MTITNELYKAYEPMVHKFVNEYSETYKIDPDELLGEAMIIFCKAAKSFDTEKKVAFSTHLWHQLRDLTSKGYREANTVNTYYAGMNSDSCEDVPPNKYNQGLFEVAISSIDFSNTTSDLMYDIALQLSENAQLCLKDIFRGTFQAPKNFKGGRPQKFPIQKICDQYNWTVRQATEVKAEITEWWNEYRITA